jgi:Intrinsic membrane protein PufX
MNDDSMFSGMTRKQRLRAEVAYLMAKGAGAAAAVFFGIWIMIGVLHWIGTTILPEDSQLAEDPGQEAFRALRAQNPGPVAIPPVPGAAADE